MSDIRSDHLTASAPRFQRGIRAGRKHVNWAKTGPYAVSQAAAEGSVAQLDAGIGRARSQGGRRELRIMMDLYRDDESSRCPSLTKPRSWWQQTGDSSISSTRMRLSQNARACGTLSFITTITHTNGVVEFVLMTVFHIPKLDALALTLAVHTKGKGIAGTYTFEIAEQKQCDVILLAKIEEHPLRVEVERV